MNLAVNPARGRHVATGGSKCGWLDDLPSQQERMKGAMRCVVGRRNRRLSALGRTPSQARAPVPWRLLQRVAHFTGSLPLQSWLGSSLLRPWCKKVPRAHIR